MLRRVGLVHTTIEAIRPMTKVFHRLAPDVALVNFVDENLLAAVNDAGEVTPDLLRRFVRLVGMAFESRIDGVVFTCSAFSPHAPQLQPLFAKPVVSVNGAMLEAAVETGGRIGVISTVPAAGPVVAGELRANARVRGRNIQVETAVVNGAFQELCAGNLAKHDLMIKDKVAELAKQVDVIVFAQISMARAVAALDNVQVPVLTGPESSVKALLKCCGQ